MEAKGWLTPHGVLETTGLSFHEIQTLSEAQKPESQDVGMAILYNPDEVVGVGWSVGGLGGMTVESTSTEADGVGLGCSRRPR